MYSGRVMVIELIWATVRWPHPAYFLRTFCRTSSLYKGRISSQSHILMLHRRLPRRGANMDRSAKRRHHEQARKRRKQEHQQHARQAAKKQRSAFPRWLLVGAVAIVLAFVLAIAFGR